MTKSLEPSASVIKFIKSHEGLRLKAYQCQAGRWTIGYGHTGLDVKANTVWTKAKAEEVFAADVARFAMLVRQNLKPAVVSQKQFDALVSFTFNVGAHNLRISSLLRKLKAGDVKGAADEFPKWKYAGGEVSNGLVKRRAAERALFLEGSNV